MSNTKKSDKKYGVIYARYSSDRQREESIDGQIRVCTEYAKRNHITLIHTYVDRAMSARTDRRPDFQQMILDSAGQKFQYIIVYQLDRFARDRYDSAFYKNKLKKNKVKVLSAMENLSDDPSSIILESVLVGMAEYYSVELAQKVRRGMTENALELKWPGGIIPLGFDLAPDKTLVINERGAETVRLIFDMFTSGKSIPSIIKHLNESGYRTRAGKRFSRSSLCSILKNERYIGVWKWSDIRREHAIPAIIDEKTFHVAQEILTTRQQRFGVKGYRPDEYALTGKLFCGLCGSPMIGISGTSRNHTIYHYYCCNNKNHNHACNCRNLNRDKTERLILDGILNLLNNKEAIEVIAKQAAAAQQEDTKPIRIQQLEQGITDAKKKINNCIRAIENGILSDALKNTLSENEERLEELKNELAHSKIISSKLIITPMHVKFFLMKMLEGDPRTWGYRDKIFSTFIHKIEYTGNAFLIYCNYKKELPILNNPLKISSSRNRHMVGDNGLEPLTSCL